MAKRGKLPKLQEKKLRVIFFSNQLPGFTVITKNLDASKREGTFLYMQFGMQDKLCGWKAFQHMKFSEKSNFLKLGQININTSSINK